MSQGRNDKDKEGETDRRYEKAAKRILTPIVTRKMTRNMTKLMKRMGTKKNDCEIVKGYDQGR